MDLIEKLHSLNIIHNDIKMENIMIGRNDPQNIYLIDFGLSNSLLDADGNHYVKKYLGKFSGNFIFATLNACRGFNKSRRDDVESFLYLIIYLLN